MRKKFLSMVLSAALCFSLIPAPAFAATNGVQINTITFPDEGFRTYVLNHYDYNSDGFLQATEINETTSMVIDNTTIKNLKGIEYFDRVTELYCLSNPQLESADLSKNSQLEKVYINENQLTELVLGTFPVLCELNCSDNKLTSINVTRCPALKKLSCANNKLTELDVSNNHALEAIQCKNNEIKTLDISNNPELVELDAHLNNITSINTEKNSKLEKCYYMPKTFEMPVRENLSMDALPTFLDEYTSERGRTLTARYLNLNKEKNTISLDEGKDEGTLTVSDYYGSYVYTLYYRYPMKSVSIEGLYKVDDSTYKVTATGKEIKVNPVVRDENNKVLEKDKDYTVELDKEKTLNTGAYKLTVKGKGKYKGTISKNIIVTPKPVTGVKVRHSTASGGYDDAYLTWNPSKGVTGYQVYARRPSKTKKWTFLGRTTKTSFLEKNLYDGWKYEFLVYPYVDCNDERYRTMEDYSVVSMTTLKKAYRPSAKKYNSSRVRISWKDIAGESGYQVRASRSGKTTYLRTTGKAMNIKVAKGKKYTYKVRAYKYVTKNGEKVRVYGPWSDSRTYTLR